MQASGLVPIVEPEVLLDGDHGIDRTLEVAEAIWAETFKYLADNKVIFEGILLKPSMVTPGAECPKRSNPEEVAAYTLKLLKRRVPPAVPGALPLPSRLPRLVLAGPPQPPAGKKIIAVPNIFKRCDTFVTEMLGFAFCNFQLALCHCTGSLAESASLPWSSKIIWVTSKRIPGQLHDQTLAAGYRKLSASCVKKERSGCEKIDQGVKRLPRGVDRDCSEGF